VGVQVAGKPRGIGSNFLILGPPPQRQTRIQNFPA
jgi:hypothetical protein